ncbi:hypothetical protein [Spiroplasma endosymbiont of Monopis laevigella]
MTKIKKNKNNYHIATKLVHCGNYNDKFGARLFNNLCIFVLQSY